jgi:glucose uptake protein GlcU
MPVRDVVPDRTFAGLGLVGWLVTGAWGLLSLVSNPVTGSPSQSFGELLGAVGVAYLVLLVLKGLAKALRTVAGGDDAE